MPTAERQALARRADLKPIVRKNVHRAAWADLNRDVQRKLAEAIDPNPKDDAAYTKALELVRSTGVVKRPAIQDALGLGFDEVNALMERMERDGVVTAAKPNGERSLVDAAAVDVQAFAPETGTLGIPRADMPQVPTQSHGGLVKHLNSQGIAHETTTVDAAALKPTQAEYSPAKVEAAKTAGGDRAVIVSSDGHIIDGHHQAMAAAEDGKPVKAIVLDAPVEQALEAVKKSPSAQQPNAEDQVPVKQEVRASTGDALGKNQAVKEPFALQKPAQHAVVKQSEKALEKNSSDAGNVALFSRSTHSVTWPLSQRAGLQAVAEDAEQRLAQFVH